ncbi:hypothetical protein J2Y03_003453 [Neobacillus niacini]|nr:hypothetical protein [Neobacillus niacini]
MGQERQEIACGCLKRQGLGTREAGNCLEVSEEAGTWDKRGRKLLVDV